MHSTTTKLNSIKQREDDCNYLQSSLIDLQRLTCEAKIRPRSMLSINGTIGKALTPGVGGGGTSS